MRFLKFNHTPCRLIGLTISVMAFLLLGIVESSGAADDKTPPQLISLSVAPSTVDVSDQPQTVTFTANITDDSSGFSLGQMIIASQSGNQSHSASAVKLSGTGLDGIWTFTIQIPQSSETGTWKVTQIRLQDVAGNMLRFPEDRAIPAGLDIQVTGVTGPQLKSLTIAPTTVNVRYPAQTVTLTAQITDNPSGLGYASGQIIIKSPSGNESSSNSVPAVRSSGTVLDGVWTFTIPLPQSSETGTWTVTGIHLQDVAGNVAEYTEEKGNLAAFTEGKGIQVTNSADTMGPQLKSLTVAPATVDVSTQSRTVAFTVRITDDSSGYSYGLITITSPSGRSLSNVTPSVSSSGTSYDGVWTFEISLPQSSEAGTWRVTEIHLWDVAGNPADYTEMIGNLAEFTEGKEVQVTGWPQLVSLTIAPTTVYISNQPKTVVFTAHIRDDLSDFTWGLIMITSPSGNESQSNDGPAVLISGNFRNGYWKFEITLPTSSETGLWKISQILFQDGAGNVSSFKDTRTINLVSGLEPGDVNHSNNVNLLDAMVALQILSGMIPAESVFMAAEVNGDDRIGVAEVIHILQKVAGLR
jgi:serine protease